MRIVFERTHVGYQQDLSQHTQTTKAWAKHYTASEVHFRAIVMNFWFDTPTLFDPSP